MSIRKLLLFTRSEAAKQKGTKIRWKRGIPMAARKATVKVAAIGSHKFGRFGERGTNATSLGYGSEYSLA